MYSTADNRMYTLQYMYSFKLLNVSNVILDTWYLKFVKKKKSISLLPNTPHTKIGPN